MFVKITQFNLKFKGFDLVLKTCLVSSDFVTILNGDLPQKLFNDDLSNEASASSDENSLVLVKFLNLRHTHTTDKLSGVLMKMTQYYHDLSRTTCTQQRRENGSVWSMTPQEQVYSQMSTLPHHVLVRLAHAPYTPYTPCIV